MKPNIAFLGTGHGPTVVGKQIRASGGIVVQSGEHQIHIDPGPGLLIMAREYYVNPRETTCILVSHPHINHCNDINILIDAMTLNGLDKKGVLIANDLLVNGDRIFPPYLTEFHRNCLEKFMVLKADQKAGIDDIEIHATSTKHSIDSIGFKIITPEFIVSYLSDTQYHSKIRMDHKNSDILILNVVKPFHSSSNNNLTSDDVVKIINQLKPRLTVMTHFSMDMLKVDPLLEARKINRLTKSQVIAAKDGMTINPLTHAIKRRQTKLNSF